MSLASLLEKGSLRGAANAIPANFAKPAPDTLPTLARLATLALANTTDRAANDGDLIPDDGDKVSTPAATDDPDRWAWPHSAAMTGAEIDTFTARLARFTDKGLTLDDGEALADKLVMRDREADDRRLCLECTHLAGHGVTSWRCGDWQAAKVAHRARDVQLPADLVRKLQRCDGFTGTTT